MDNILQFVFAYNNSNVCNYFNEICSKLYLEPICDITDVLFAIIDTLIKTHNLADILKYNHIIPLVEYIIKQVKLKGVVMTRDKIPLIDVYKKIITTLYPNSEFAKHVHRYIDSVSIDNNIMLLFKSSPIKQSNQEFESVSLPKTINIEDLLQRIEKLENEVRELKSKS